MLGPVLLTRLLEGVLKRSAPSRVIFVSSGGMLTRECLHVGPAYQQSPYEKRVKKL